MISAERRVLIIVLACTIMGLPGTSSADFNVHHVQTRLSAQALEVSAKMDLRLSNKAAAALAKGIPLSVVINIALLEHRSILWDRTIATRDLHRTLQFHALSNEYLVGGSELGSDEYENFLSLDEALHFLGRIDDLRLPLGKTALDADQDYHVRVRVYLDIGSLPFPLRPMAYTSPSWHLNSGWTTWSVQR